MPRVYRRPVNATPRNQHSEIELVEITAAVRNGLSYGEIPIAAIHRQIKHPATKTQSAPPRIMDEEAETLLAKRLVICGKWEYLFTILDLKLVAKGYLDGRGIKYTRLRNTPGDYWVRVRSVLRRQDAFLSQRIFQNIKRSRASVSPSTIKSFFEQLPVTLENVPASNIVNYDETDLRDDPGSKKGIVKRGTKYPLRILNSSKSTTPVMHAGSAEGTLLLAMLPISQPTCTFCVLWAA